MTFKFVTESWHWLTPLRCAANLSHDKGGNLLCLERSAFRQARLRFRRRGRRASTSRAPILETKNPF